MEHAEQAGSVWARLHGLRQPLITRVERYAALTIPRLCLPDGFNVESMDQTHDYQSLGAQAVNHLTNKLMTAMFAPSRPFFRVATGKKTKENAAKANIPEGKIDEILAKMERDSSVMLDKKRQRPKLYLVCKQLIVTGNCLMILDKDNIRVMGLKYWCVKRTTKGEVHTLVIKETLCFNELDPRIQALWTDRYKGETKVDHFKLIKRDPKGGYSMTQWIDDTKLPKEFDGRWSSEAKLPYRVLAWELADESDYGTGHVEDYAGDFEALSVLSEALVTGAVVGTEFRWVVNPAGMTNADDLRDSVTGDVFAGNTKDVGAIVPEVSNGVKMAQVVGQDYIQRISRGFLMGSAVTRQAERVTAEEVRLTAMELEASFGGTYSSLAPSMQEPIAHWMLATADTPLGGSDLDIVIVTGLDALSRNGDLENLRLAIGDLSGLMQVPPELVARIKWDDIAEFVGQGRGVDLKRFVMNSEEFAAVQQAAMARQQAQDVSTAGGVAQAEAAAQPQE